MFSALNINYFMFITASGLLFIAKVRFFHTLLKISEVKDNNLLKQMLYLSNLTVIKHIDEIGMFWVIIIFQFFKFFV